MKNDDLLKKLTETLSGVMDGSIDVKGAKAVTKQADAFLKEKMKQLKILNEISKIAKNKGETLVAKKRGAITLYGVPVESKEFFGNYINEPKQLFKVKGVNYIVVHQSALFE